MPKLQTSEVQELIDQIDRYINCFYERNIEALREMYVSDGEVVFFDNHSSCDTSKLADHLDLVSEFFKSGEIVALKKENIQIFSVDDYACVTLTLRYATHPKPGVRTTMVFEKEFEIWKVRHVHHSTDPNEA